jgi:hypothetical protein
MTELHALYQNLRQEKQDFLNRIIRWCSRPQKLNRSAPDGVSRTLTFETGLSGISQLI